jgi:hypothetical protein
MGCSKLIQRLNCATLMISLFLPGNANKFITRTLLPLHMIIQELIVICSENQTQGSCQGCSRWENQTQGSCQGCSRW